MDFDNNLFPKNNSKTLDRPDSVINFFMNHGFSKTQILDLIRKRPTLFLSDPNKIFLPKFEFFYSIGISSTELANMVSMSPIILTYSLENHIIPSFTLFINLFHSNDKFITAFKRFPRIVDCYRSDITFSNIENLRQHSVFDSNIMYGLIGYGRPLNVKPDRFNEVVEDVKKMGFNPTDINFVIVVRALNLKLMSKTTLKMRMEVYQKWGWYEEETMLAFTKCLCCMMISEEKINAVLNFYVNTMGWESSLIAHRPELMSLSLGLIKKPVSTEVLLKSTESVFLKKFVNCYEEAPELLKLYQEKLDLLPN
ncbi:uncharacterized protein LOC132314343 [Cornus florida]|uniref:uncharacterized protein LOC132314343 n=1 Tax=Cornus florida TaxID=4283 RepID=UPI002899A6CB|nr:uncharacterized protein LOC132314343 [Cornus florida]